MTGITSENIVRHELIGLECRIADSANKFAKGMQGTVIDETRNTLTLETKKGIKNFVKGQCVFVFKIPSPDTRLKEPLRSHIWVRVDGKLLVSRPEDRIKKRLRKW